MTDSVGSSPNLQTAIAYAKWLHAGQVRRVDGAPFILHPLEVASLLRGVGAPDHVIVAGVLHDIIEKTDADAAELRTAFGPAVATLVLAVSEDPRIIDHEERKAALREQVAQAGEEAMIVFAADKISKVRELSLEPPAPRQLRRQAGWSTRPRDRRLAHYRRCLLLLRKHLPDCPLVKQLAAELDAIGALGSGSQRGIARTASGVLTTTPTGSTE